MTKEEYEEIKEATTLTPKQQEKLDALLKHGTFNAAARALKCNPGTIAKCYKRMKQRVTLGYSKETVATQYIEHDQILKGTSTLTTLPNGDKQWIKTQADKEAQYRRLKEGLIQAISSYKGTSFFVDAPKVSSEASDWLCVLPIGDAHFGMFAWGEETGGPNWDLKENEKVHMMAIEAQIMHAEEADTCIIMDMGDFLHRNDNRNETRSGHPVDCDSRHVKMQYVAGKVLIHAVTSALRKFKNVILRCVGGNHAPEAEQALAYGMDLYFWNNPRVFVDRSPNKFWYYKWGKVLLGAHHGDKVKIQELPLIMAHDVPQWWGETLHRYFYIGHLHHKWAKEFPGCEVEIINTLTPNDAHHHASGYRAKKNLKMMRFHKEYGEVDRHTKDITYIQALLKARNHA